MKDTIEREVVISAPVSRVWSAITDSDQITQWFGTSTELELKAGGRLRFEWDEDWADGEVIEVVPERLLKYEWHPFNHIKDDVDRSLRTVVTFELSEHPRGTLLRLTESGFSKLGSVASTAFADNTWGWDEELLDLRNWLKKSA